MVTDIKGKVAWSCLIPSLEGSETPDTLQSAYTVINLLATVVNFVKMVSWKYQISDFCF